jgi:DNA polymerase I-like protein with 3'-5' exonuclease and polymerase domains
LYDKPYNEFTSSQQAELTQRGFSPDDTIPAYIRTYFEGGWDTGLAGHAIEETAQLGLEALTARYTTCPRYDIQLHEWKVAHCKEKGIKLKDLEGYGAVPDERLLPYGCYDADGTLRLMYAQMPLINDDYQHNCAREPFWESMIACPPILEMHCTGIRADKQRIDKLTEVFMKAKANKEMQIREWAKWPDFNIRSVMKVREFLFGESYSGKCDRQGNVVRQRPVDGKSLYLTPVLTTGKPARKWSEIKERGQEADYTAGTSRLVLGLLAHDNPAQFEQIQWLRDHRFLDQVLKSVLRPPKTDDDGKVIYVDADNDDLASTDYAVGDSGGTTGSDNLGSVIYEAGLAAVICDDDRVRTHLYPTAETGRWRSARPPLQNLSKRRDDDYKRMLGAVKNAKGKWEGGEYKWKLRSVLMADPGTVFVEADYKSAELFCAAILSGDRALLDHCLRNQLPEDDPNFYDIHSNIAVLAFKLACAPTKKGLAEIGKVALRVAAKNVIFGLFYGRGAPAIALQCKEEGNAISKEEAQQIIDMVLQMYPRLSPLFEQIKQRVREERWLCNSFGRLRRFPLTDDRVIQGEFERTGLNYCVQSLVASAVDRAVAYLQDYRDNVLKLPEMFTMKLQIHDALILQVPYRYVNQVAKEVLPFNMCQRVPIYPAGPDGVPLGTGPYYFGVDVEVSEHWGEPLSKEFCDANGISPEYAH